MSFISESQLSNYRRKTKTFAKSDFRNLNESLSSDMIKPMVFISHKHEEIDILQDVIEFLKVEGVDIYVDWMDEDMPVFTNSKTAIRLKEKIKAANKFILIATPSAINSKWCNWELGLGDAAKYIEHIALLPINKSSQLFESSEYLNIYPYIDYENGKYLNGSNIPKGYFVKKPLINGNVSLTPLKEWLKE